MSKEQLEMFSFEVTEVQDVTKAEFEKFEKDAQGGNNFFSDPGSYELKIIEIDNKGPVKSDPTWIGLVIKMVGVNEEKITQYITVPTCNLNYITNAGKPTKFMYKKYKEFLIALGIDEVTQENVLTFAPKLFSEGLILDLSVQATLNYEGAYAKFNGKDGDVVTYVLVHNNEVVTDATNEVEGVNQPILFTTRDAAEAHAVQMGISDFQAFISLVGWGDCPNPDQIPSGKKETKPKIKKPKAVGKTALTKTKASGQGW